VHNSPVDRRITYTSDCLILEFVTIVSGLVLGIIFGTDSGIVPEPVSF